MSPEQESVLAQVVAEMPRSCPEGWLRIVRRVECSVASGVPGVGEVAVVVVADAGGLRQETYRAPAEAFWTETDLFEDLARSSATGTVVLRLTLDRDGRLTVDEAEEDPQVLAGIRGESSSVPIHRYLERNRAELEELARRI